MIVCARCGAQNQPTNKFCLSCGAPVQQAPANPAGQAPQQGGGYGAPPAPAWGQPPPAPQPQHHAPPGASPYAQPPAQQPPQQQGWGGPPQHGQPHGGYAPQAPGYGQGAPPFQFGSPDGLNPFGATQGPPQPPQQHHYGQPPQQQPQHGHPGQPQQGAHGYPPPGQAPPQGQWGQEASYLPTSPPPTADEVPGKPGPAQRAPSSPAQGAAQVPSSRPGRDPETVEPNAPRALAAFLVSYEGSELGTFYPIHQGQNLVGRKGAAPGLAIELEHGTTSSRHAMILASARPGRVKIEDVGSTNGTFVGDLMLERGKKHELKDGDVIRFGGYVTIIKII